MFSGCIFPECLLEFINIALELRKIGRFVFYKKSQNGGDGNYGKQDDQ